MLETGKRLEAAGADFLIMPCNTAHYFHRELQQELDIPLLHMIKLSAKHVTENFSSSRNTGLLATDGTIASRLYHDAYLEKGIDTITPTNSSQENVMKAIYNYIKTGDLVKGSEILYKVANELIENGADLIICGCTEVSLVLHDGNLSVPVVDPLQVLAEEAIHFASV
jgi:aspartate racemase